MRRLVMFSVLALLVCAPTALTQQPFTGVIEGIALDAISGQPVSGAHVVLTAYADGMLGFYAWSSTITSAAPPIALPEAPPVQVPPTATSIDGRFSFKQLRAGNYRVVVTASGYVRQEYGPGTVNGLGKVIYLTVGEAFRDATVRLVPTGTVSGRVLNENGQPAMGAPVQLLRPIYGVLGKGYRTVGAANSDNLGQYRIQGVPPGRYILAAGNPPDTVHVPGLGRAPQGAPRYALLYYPNVQDVEQATLIEVKSSAEVTMDMRLTRQVQTYSVRGRVIDATTGMPVSNFSVSLWGRYLNFSSVFSSGEFYNAAMGTFELRNVPPGDYIVQAQLQVISPPRTDSRLVRASTPFAQGATRVVNADVDGIVLTLEPGATVGARVQLEGRQISSIANLDQIRMNLLPTIPRLGDFPATTPLQSDGTFQILGFREGEYQMVNILMPAGNLYVKSVHYRGDDIYTRPFRFTKSGSGTMDIVLRTGTAQVNGMVTNAQNQPVSGIQIVAFPLQRERPDTIRSAITSQSGRFNMVSLPPGDYRVFSWESTDNSALYDPEFVKQTEQRGVLVHLAESDRQTVDVKRTPAP